MLAKDYDKMLLAIADIDSVVVDNNLKKLENVFPSHRGALLPIKSVADWLGVTVKVLKEDKEFPLKKISDRYYVSRIGLARWLV